MTIDLKIITQLRNQTGAGIADCQSALEEANSDLDKAIEILRKKGEIKAAKKADRTTHEGVVAIAKNKTKTAVIVLTCETDFVSRNENFISAASEYANKLLAMGEAGFENWAEENIKKDLVLKIGENINLDDFGLLEGETLGFYLHSNKKIAAVVYLVSGNEELANVLAMQIVAMSPKCLRPEDLPVAELAKEKKIYRAQMKDENKPVEIREKIIMGKLNKYYEEVCLLNQQFIKDDTKKIADLLKEAGEDVVIKEFRKFSV